MDVTDEVILLLGLAALGFWKPMGWVLIIAGIGVMSMALNLMDTDEAYTIPYLFLGLGQFLLGVFRVRITGR